MKKLIGALSVLLFALPAFASAATIQISMGATTFSPASISVQAGDTVIWSNTSAMPHTVTADDNSFNSGNIASGQTYSHTFTTAGTVKYYCAYHGGPGGVGMAGSVVVNAAAATAPPVATPPPVATIPTSQNTTGLQAQAQALLQQVAQLQAQLAAQTGASVGGTPGITSLNPNPSGAISIGATQAANSSACPNIGRVLKKGSSGDDVTRLQQFLALDPSVYPEGTISGYFGPLTEKAVQRWQVKYNIVSNGTPATTGFGVVGPRTAAAIALLCSTGASSPVGGYIQVSPISGNAPLNVNVVATVNSTNSCASAIYSLNWGDGTNSVSIPVSANTCTQLAQTYQHSYVQPGTYQITLSSGAHQTGATIVVYGTVTGGTGTTGSTGSTGSTGALPSETFTASPISGPAPLAVTFSGVLTGQDAGWCANGCSDILIFGDGSQGAIPLPLAQNAIQSYTVAHTYNTAGTYTAILYQGQAGNGRPTVGTATITVGGGSSQSSSLNPPTLTPNYQSNPKAVSLGFDIAGCTSYTINWGDSSSVTNGTSTCNGGTVTMSSQHTYSGNGSFTIVLTRGSQTNSVGVTINQ